VNTTHVAGSSQTAGDIVADTNDIQARLPAALVGGRMDANVGAISGDSTAADNLEAYTDGTTPQPVNVTQFGGSNGSFASGRPEVNATHIGGSAISQTGGVANVNVTQISGDSTAADNLESYTDGTTPMPVNVTQLSGDATAADNAEAAFDGSGYNVGGGSIVAASVTGNVGGNVAGSVGSVAAGGIAASSFAAGAIDASAIAADAIGSSELAASAAAEIATAVRSELTTELGRIDVATSTRASQASVDTIDDFLDTEVAAILADTDELQQLLTPLVELDSDGGRRFTADALSEAPTGGAAPTAGEIADAVWDEALSGHQGAGSAGEALASADVAASIIDSLTEEVSDGLRFSAFALEEAPTGASAPTASEIADAVWDEALSGHLSPGSAGAALDDAADGFELLDSLTETVSDGTRFSAFALEEAPTDGSAPTAGDIADAVWAEALPGSYSAGQAGKIVGDNLNATVGSRATQTSVDTIDGIVDAILVDTAEIGAAGAGLSAIPWNAAWDAEVQSEATDALNAYDPPTHAELLARTLASADYATATALAAVDDFVDTEVAAIKSTTDKLELMLEQVSDGYRFSAFALEEAADGILRTQMTESYAADGAAMTVEQALYMLWAILAERNISGTTLTIKKLDGSTDAMTFTTNSATTPTSQTRAT
jgi:hypothetical protein